MVNANLNFYIQYNNVALINPKRKLVQFQGGFILIKVI